MGYRPGDGKDIPLRDFAPDLGVDTPGIILDAVGAQPSISGFRPLSLLADLNTDPLPNRPIGSHYANYSDGSFKLFAATEGGLWWLDSGGWVNAAAFPTTEPFVNFTQFGDDVLAVGPGSGLDRRIFIAPTGSSVFNFVANSPLNPVAIIGVSAQVLAFAGQEWFSSAAGDDNDWTPSIATLSATGTLYDVPGAVVAASSIYRQVLAFKRGSIFLGQQSGAPFSWSWEVISNKTGTWGQGCTVKLPNAVAFLGNDDFYITTGYAPQPIPNNLKEWFFRTVSRAYLPYTMSWYDTLTSIIYWHFVSRDAPTPPIADMFVSYNVRARRWCVGHLPVSSATHLAFGGLTIPSTSEQALCAIFNDSFVPQTFCGETGFSAMTLLTGYYGEPSRLSQLMRVRPKYQTYPTSEYLKVFRSNVLGQDDEDGPIASLGADGWHNVRQYARYHRALLATEGDCEVAGFAFESRPGGIR